MKVASRILAKAKNKLQQSRKPIISDDESDSTVANTTSDSTVNFATDSAVSVPKSTPCNDTRQKVKSFSNKFVQTESLEECDKCENLIATNTSLISKIQKQEQTI